MHNMIQLVSRINGDQTVLWFLGETFYFLTVQWSFIYRLQTPLTLGMLGNFSWFFGVCWFFSKLINNHQSGKQFGSKLFAKLSAENTEVGQVQNYGLNSFWMLVLWHSFAFSINYQVSFVIWPLRSLIGVSLKDTWIQGAFLKNSLKRKSTLKNAGNWKALLWFYYFLYFISVNGDQNQYKTRAEVDGTPSQIPAFWLITLTLGSRSHKM